MRVSPRLIRSVLCLTLFASAVALRVPAASATTVDGHPDSTWMTNGYVYAQAQWGNVLFIGGFFTQVRSLPPGTPGGTIVKLSNLAAIDMTTGAAIPSFKPIVTEDAFTGGNKFGVRALAVVGDQLYVGGQFTTVDGETHNNLARYNLDPYTMTMTVDSTFNPSVGDPTDANFHKVTVYKVLPVADGVMIGGAFSWVSGFFTQKVAKLNTDGTVNTAFRTKGVNGGVRDIQSSLDGVTLFVSGGFSNFNGVARQSIVRIDELTGANDLWAIPAGQVPIGGPNAPHYGMICWSLVVTPTRLFAGCGETPNYDAAFRLDNGNSGDRTWLFSTSGNDQRIALSADGQTLIFGGHFGTYLSMSVCSGKYLKNLGYLHNIYGFSTPSLDCSFLPQFWGPDPFGGVWSILVTPTAVWVGGRFTMVDCTMGPARPGQPSYVACPNGRVQRGIARFSVPTP
jgi:hypothetical protein